MSFSGCCQGRNSIDNDLKVVDVDDAVDDVVDGAMVGGDVAASITFVGVAIVVLSIPATDEVLPIAPLVASLKMKD